MINQSIPKQKKQFSFSEPSHTAEGPFRRFLEITLKIHQIFALVDVNFESVLNATSRNINTVTHLAEVAEQLALHNGLNYVPRERSSNGRVFEHAADSKVLIDHLSQIQDKKAKVIEETSDTTYYIKIIDEPVSKDAKA